MPDDKPGEGIQKEPTQQVAAPEPVDPPPPPDTPHSTAGESESDEEMKRDVKDIDYRVKRAERWMIGLTFAIAFFALCTVVVAILQWRVMSGQLAEMKNGGTDTHDLAVAATTQSQAMEIAAEAQRTQAASAVESLQKADIAHEASERQSKAALDAGIAASKIDQRPWVVVEDAHIVDAFLKDDANSQYQTGVVFTLKNVGKSPAQNVWPVVEIANFASGMARQKAECSGMPIPRRLGITIYPGQARGLPVTVQISQREIAAIGGPSFAQLLIVGCFGYQGNSVRDDFLTGIMYQITRANGYGIDLNAIDRLTPEKLGLRDSLFGDFSQ